MSAGVADRARAVRQTHGAGRQRDRGVLRDVHLLRRQSVDRKRPAAAESVGGLVLRARPGCAANPALARPGSVDRRGGAGPPEHVALWPSGIDLALCVDPEGLGPDAQIHAGGVADRGNRPGGRSRDRAQLRRDRRPGADLGVRGHELLQRQQPGRKRQPQGPGSVRPLDGRPSPGAKRHLQGLRRERIGTEPKGLRGVELLVRPRHRLCHRQSSRLVASRGPQASLLRKRP